ncbi:MAG: PAS domain-containing protein [Desulfobacterales bacterium]
MIDSSNDLIFLKDANSGIWLPIKCVNVLSQVFVIIGKKDGGLLPPALAEKCNESDRQALQLGRIVKEEVFGDRFYSVIKQRVQDARGNIIGVAGVIRDVTENGGNRAGKNPS